MYRRHLAGVFVLLSTVAGAQAAPPIARYVPRSPDPAHVFVLDSAHILAASTINALQDSARALQSETGADVAWVTLPTLGGRSIEEAALYIGRTWRIGSAGRPGDELRNRGLVILYVPDKRTTAGANFRIEVGNGLEGTITDSRSRSITMSMREGLRAKNYDEAYLAGWDVAASLVREDFASRGQPSRPSAEQEAVPANSHSARSLVIASVVITFAFIAMLLGIILLFVFRRRGPPGAVPAGVVLPTGDDDDDEPRRRSRWSSDSDSSSNDSSSSSSSHSFGGGGGFSGGGSSDTI